MRKRIMITPFFLLIAFYVFWAISGHGRVANYLATISCLFILVLDINKYQSINFLKRSYLDKSIICFFCFFCFYCLTSLFNINNVVYWLGNVLAYMFVSYFPLILYRKINIKYNIESKIKILKIILVIWTGMVLYSCVYFLTHPGVARDAIVYQSQFDNLFIGGGYFLAFGSAVLAVFVAGLLKQGIIYKKNHKALSFCFICLSFFHVLLTNSTLTLIWIVVGLLAVLFLTPKTSRKNHNKKKTILFLCIVIVIILFLIFRNQIGTFFIDLGNYNSSSLYEKRVYELGTVIRGSTFTRHTSDRLSRPLMSFELFAKSPIIGIGYKNGYIFSQMQQYGLGNHSEIVDSLAKYGIIGSSLLLGVFYNFIKFIQSKLYPKESSYWWIIMLAMMSFNPFISMPSLIAVFLIIPLVTDSLMKNNKE